MLYSAETPRPHYEFVINGRVEGDFEYEPIGTTEDGRTAMAITRYHGDELASTIEIPAEIGGVVTTICSRIFFVPIRESGCSFYVNAGNDTLHEVIVPEGVTTIERYAFRTLFPCDDLTITIPSTVTYIGEKIEDFPPEDPELQAEYDNIDCEKTLDNGLWIFMKDGSGYAQQVLRRRDRRRVCRE